MQKALEGASKIVILATISQSAQCYDESVNTISFATRAKNIVQVVPQNKGCDAIDPAVREAYESKIRQLERKIQMMERASQRNLPVLGRKYSEKLNTTSYTNEPSKGKVMSGYVTSRRSSTRTIKKAESDLPSELEDELESQIGSILTDDCENLCDGNCEVDELPEMNYFEALKSFEKKMAVRVVITAKELKEQKKVLSILKSSLAIENKKLLEEANRKDEELFKIYQMIEKYQQKAETQDLNSLKDTI